MWARRIGKFMVEMCKTWGALVTGGFLIGLFVSWQLTGHTIPVKIGWAIIIGAVVIAAFQVWTRQLSLTEQANHSRELEREEHAKVLAALYLELESSRIQNNPYLTFNVDSEMNGTLCDISLTVANAGQFPTKIVEGQMELKSSIFPAVHQAINLAGIELVGKGHRTIKMTVKRTLLYVDNNSGPQPAELCISTFYSQPKGSASQFAKYLYIHQARRFEPAK